MRVMNGPGPGDLVQRLGYVPQLAPGERFQSRQSLVQYLASLGGIAARAPMLSDVLQQG
jgi:hypothetical protein